MRLRPGQPDPMTTFDWVVLCIIALSTLLAFFRGVVRELVATIAWVLGVVGAITFTPVLAALLPDLPGYPAVRYIVAFALIIIGALLVGALIAWPLSNAVRAAGLGFVDRFLGSIFGILRGAAFVLAFVLVAIGHSMGGAILLDLAGEFPLRAMVLISPAPTPVPDAPLPRTLWWQSAALVPPLVAGVYALKPHLPAQLAGRLDYSPGGMQRRGAPEQQT